MARGRHRTEPVRRSLSRPRLIVGVGGSALLGVALVAGLTVGTPGRTLQTVVASPGSQVTMSDTAANALQFGAGLEGREQARTSRDRADLPVPPTVPTATPTAVPVEPAPQTAESIPPAEPAPAAVAVEPVPAPEPVAAVPVPVPVVVGQMWATADVNVRSGPSPDNESLGLVAALTQVDVTGVTDSGWTQTLTGGQTGWIKSSYLSESKPEPAPASLVSNAPCSISADIESYLTGNAGTVYRAVCAAFGDTVSSFGGYRRGDDGDHGSGRALDIMVTGEPGWDIARYVQAHAAELNVTYVIYQQRIWHAGNPAGQWTSMSDRGSATANHYDHVHVSVS